MDMKNLVEVLLAAVTSRYAPMCSSGQMLGSCTLSKVITGEVWLGLLCLDPNWTWNTV